MRPGRSPKLRKTNRPSERPSGALHPGWRSSLPPSVTYRRTSTAFTSASRRNRDDRKRLAKHPLPRAGDANPSLARGHANLFHRRRCAKFARPDLRRLEMEPVPKNKKRLHGGGLVPCSPGGGGNEDRDISSLSSSPWFMPRSHP